jgi:hypothetical protein
MEDILSKHKPQPWVLSDFSELKKRREEERVPAVRTLGWRKVFEESDRIKKVEPRGIDGVRVELGESWKSEYMRRQPKDRTD